MPRLSLQHYDIPDYASHIPNIPRSERPLQKIADLLYALHGIQWFKKKKEGGDGLATADGNIGLSQDDLSKDTTEGIVNDDLAKRAVDKAREVNFGLDQSKPIELQLLAGTLKPTNGDSSDVASEPEKDYDLETMKAALKDADEKRGRKFDLTPEQEDDRARTKAKAEQFKDTFGDVGNDDLDKAFPELFKESKVSKDARDKFADEQEADLMRYVRNIARAEDMNGYEPTDFSPEEYAELFEMGEGGSDVEHARKVMEGYHPSGDSREPDRLWGKSMKSSDIWED